MKILASKQVGDVSYLVAEIPLILVGVVSLPIEQYPVMMHRVVWGKMPHTTFNF